jgi:hypothetical protein
MEEIKNENLAETINENKTLTECEEGVLGTIKGLEFCFESFMFHKHNGRKSVLEQHIDLMLRTCEDLKSFCEMWKKEINNE